MTYGNININEERGPFYAVQGTVSTANGTAIVDLTISVEGSDPAFVSESDAIFQDLLDRISDSPDVTFGTAQKRWTATRNVTPTP